MLSLHSLLKEAALYAAQGKEQKALELLGRSPIPPHHDLPQAIKVLYTNIVLQRLEDAKKPFPTPASLEECVSLDDVARYFGTDKSSELHNLCAVYEEIFAGLKNSTFHFFEFGVLDFASVNMWGTWFPNAHIFGVDPGSSDKVQNIKKKNVSYIQADAFNKDIMLPLLKKFPPTIILDDATHYYSHQIYGFENYFELLEPGGFYIVEDISTSYGIYQYGVWNDCAQNPGELFSDMAKLVNYHDKISHRTFRLSPHIESLCRQISYIVFVQNAVIIKKR